MIPFSILDLASIRQGGDAGQSFKVLLNQARNAENLGYNRYWLAEHHNMAGIGSAATNVLVGYVAGATKTMRVGAGGVMLPNHSPLMVAETYGTLELLYPGRIDLGLGRASGTDQQTTRALRQDSQRRVREFPQDVVELRAYFRDPKPQQKVHAVPGEGLQVPLWLLGMSPTSAQLAATLGLPYVYASHFSPDQLKRSLQIYRGGFRPSEYLERPYVMVSVNVAAADTDEEARHLFTSTLVRATDMRRGGGGMLGPPIEDMDEYWTPAERHFINQKLSCSLVGSAETVHDGMANFIQQTGADEVITTMELFDPATCRRSLEILADVRQRLALQRSRAAG